MVNAAEADPLCCPGTTVLRNKLGIEDQADLDEVELALFLIRADEPIASGALDYAHYRAGSFAGDEQPLAALIADIIA